jgi:hypothetical protein
MMPRIAQASVLGQADDPPWAFVGFILVWCILGLASFLFFHFNRNVALKRRVLPVLTVIVVAMFLGVVYYFIGSSQPLVFVFAVPAVVVISYLNIRMTRFCNSCGKTLHQQLPFTTVRFCPHCGAELGDP